MTLQQDWTENPFVELLFIPVALKFGMLSITALSEVH